MEEQVPFLLGFRRVVPTVEVALGLDVRARYDADRQMWLDVDGLPLYANRASKPYTNAYTSAHVIKGGFTPSGKYRPPKMAPGKMDKRSGK